MFYHFHCEVLRYKKNKKKNSHTYKVLIGIIAIIVWWSVCVIFVWLLDNVLHVLDILNSYRHHLLQKKTPRQKSLRTQEYFKWFKHAHGPCTCTQWPTWVCCRYHWTFLTSCLTAFSRLLNSFSSLSNISSLTYNKKIWTLKLNRQYFQSFTPLFHFYKWYIYIW